ITARGVWHTPTSMPSYAAVKPLHPTSANQVSHVPPGVYLMMSPGPLVPRTKFEKKKACSLVIHVGPSFQSYLNVKSPQTAWAGPAIGAGKGPAGQANRAVLPGPPSRGPASPPAPPPLSVDEGALPASSTGAPTTVPDVAPVALTTVPDAVVPPLPSPELDVPELPAWPTLTPEPTRPEL